MQDLREFIQVNEKFQKSINLRLDYNRQEKIAGYIPTKASVQVLSAYLQQFQQWKSDRASILIGPYGKGKSQLLLVLLALLSKENKGQAFVGETIERIKTVEKEAGSMAEKLFQSEKSYLPVILTGAQGDFHRALMLSLKDSLEREGVSQIAPSTYFDEAEKTLLMWKESYPQTYQQFLEYLKEEGIKEKTFLQCLRRYDEKVLEIFQKIYPKLTAGSVFEPMVQTDVISLYGSVNKALHRHYGYQGMVLIFDEFSKFVEGYSKEKFAAAMEELQDLCELAANSKEESFHVILVAHKAMKEYKNILPKEVVNAYMGVEGRISEIYFTTSLKNSYELLDNVIVKKHDKSWTALLSNERFRDMLENSYALPYFQTLFRKKEFEKIVAEGCYPMTPVAAYLLLKISEQAVQNERTVFTFLSKDEPYGLIHFLQEPKEESITFLDSGRVYDYFSKICRGDTANEKLHNEWLKAEYALNGLTDKREQVIIKTIALIRMVGKADEIFARDEVIRLGAGLTRQEYQQGIEHLKEKELILFRSKLGSYSFKNNIGVDLEKEIRQVIEKRFQSISVCEEINKYSELTYEFPKRYNLNYKITRYFHYHFMTVEQFLKLKNPEYLFQEQFSDGKILALVRQQQGQEEEISAKVAALDERRMVVLLPKEIFDGTKMLQRLCALKYLKSSEEFIQQNKALLQELSLYEEDLLFEFQVYLETYLLPSMGNCHVFYGDKIYPRQYFARQRGDSKFNQFLSDILEVYYEKTPKINNELINRRYISSQMKKARQKLIGQIIRGEDCSGYQKGTAPEATIYRAVFVKTGVISFQKEKLKNKDKGTQKVLKHIVEFFKSSAGEKKSFAELYQKLLGKGYGVRLGVIPLYLAYCISMLQALPVIYREDREVKLDGAVFDNINDSPSKFYLYIERSSYEKEEYLKALERVFGREDRIETDKLNRLEAICDDIYQWYCSLPQCARSYGVEDKKENIRRGIKKFRILFSKPERNPREVLLVNLPSAFELHDYHKLAGQLEAMRQEMDHYLWNLKNQVVYGIRKNFGFSGDKDLKKSFDHWYEIWGSRAETQVGSRQVIEFLKTVRQLSTHDEHKIADFIVKSVLDVYIEDFQENHIQQFVNQLSVLKKEIEQQAAKSGEKRSKIVFTNSEGREVQRYFQMEKEDGTSTFLQNEIESTLEEYGDSLEVNQKISVMVRMIEKLLEG
ncbi:MAG: hypothetical protein K2M46_07245 [Lachnospiraceae bacterium]|nr:hypothetical protein [Lachnospiraceae bacterium]